MLNNYNKASLILTGVIVSFSAYALVNGNLGEGFFGIIISIGLGILHWNGD